MSALIYNSKKSCSVNTSFLHVTELKVKQTETRIVMVASFKFPSLKVVFATYQ